MNNNPKISIAIPTYNGGDYIKLQLKRFVPVIELISAGPKTL